VHPKRRVEAEDAAVEQLVMQAHSGNPLSRLSGPS
jgi:hypothetical protein